MRSSSSSRVVLCCIWSTIDGGNRGCISSISVRS
jgi:hypothetical protein